MRSNVIVTRGSLLVVFSLLLIASAFGQTQSLPPDLRRAPRTPDEAAYRQIQIQRTLEAQQRQAMREAEAIARASATLPRDPLPKLTEKDRERIESLLTPNPVDVTANAELLAQDRTGIFRMFPNANCETRLQIKVDGECANHIPGGSSYSFRGGAVTPDIHFNSGLLVGEGFFSVSIVTELGNKPLLGLDRSAAELSFLRGFEPATNFADARTQYDDIHKGIASDGKTYSNTVVPKLDTTYAIRIVAYRNGNNLLKRMQKGEPLLRDSPVVNFNTVQRDNRFDLLVAFRIIRRESDGNLTIVWKELERKKSPVITFEKDQALSDFKDRISTGPAPHSKK